MNQGHWSAPQVRARVSHRTSEREAYRAVLWVSVAAFASFSLAPMTGPWLSAPQAMCTQLVALASCPSSFPALGPGSGVCGATTVPPFPLTHWAMGRGTNPRRRPGRVRSDCQATVYTACLYRTQIQTNSSVMKPQGRHWPLCVCVTIATSLHSRGPGDAWLPLGMGSSLWGGGGGLLILTVSLGSTEMVSLLVPALALGDTESMPLPLPPSRPCRGHRCQ